jgi:hypothetical protein
VSREIGGRRGRGSGWETETQRRRATPLRVAVPTRAEVVRADWVCGVDTPSRVPHPWGAEGGVVLNSYSAQVHEARDEATQLRAKRDQAQSLLAELLEQYTAEV